MCGNFGFSKNALIALNICYVMIAFLLIGVATYGRTSAKVDSLPIVAGIAVCGAFLLLIALVGLMGTIRHHQVMLFVYMLVLGCIFVLQFSIACASLSVSEEQQLQLAEQGWDHSDNSTRLTAEKAFSCCGFEHYEEGYLCDQVPECVQGPPGSVNPSCPVCKTAIETSIGKAFSAAGGVGLFFAFTEIVGAILAHRYRNMPNPKAAPPLSQSSLYGFQ